jgi:hypothetical protein
MLFAQDAVDYLYLAILTSGALAMGWYWERRLWPATCLCFASC